MGQTSGLLFHKPGINQHETIQLTNKMINMKKFLVVVAIAAFASCNNSASTEAAKTDSAKVDSSKMAMDSSKMAMDSSAKKMDSAAKKMDSTKK